MGFRVLGLDPLFRIELERLFDRLFRKTQTDRESAVVNALDVVPGNCAQIMG